MDKEHHYSLKVEWTGNKGTGTDTYTSYTRDHNIQAGNKTVLHTSADPAFKGDKTKYNPEELFLASISSCHMLWYLHLCADHKIVVTKYIDQASGTMKKNKEGNIAFTNVLLNPKVTVSKSSMIEKANELHHEANKICFIANSCNFPVTHKPTCIAE